MVYGVCKLLTSTVCSGSCPEIRLKTWATYFWCQSMLDVFLSHYNWKEGIIHHWSLANVYPLTQWYGWLQSLVWWIFLITRRLGQWEPSPQRDAGGGWPCNGSLEGGSGLVTLLDFDPKTQVQCNSPIPPLSLNLIHFLPSPPNPKLFSYL